VAFRGRFGAIVHRLFTAFAGVLDASFCFRKSRNRVRRVAGIPLAIVLLSAGAMAQDLPDAPAPKPRR
jgi:hypothetical protein